MSVSDWLLSSDEPWTRYLTLVDLLDWPEADGEVQAAHAALLAHPQVQALLDAAATWPGPPIKRHNDAGHPLYALSTLADFGLRAGDDPRLDTAIATVLDHQSADGAFQSVLNIAPAFGGSGQDTWTWVLCDAPTLLYVVLATGAAATGTGAEAASRAVRHLANLAAEPGYRCVAAADLGKFHGPGRRSDPCPIANVYALKALALAASKPELSGTVGPSAARAAEMLLGHWQRRAEVKYYLFGAGTDYLKLKYPWVWYDLLHVLGVLAAYPPIHTDLRFHEMLAALRAQADPAGRYTAGSMYQSWKGWSFADKKQPSPWLTFLAQRILRAASVPRKEQGA